MITLGNTAKESRPALFERPAIFTGNSVLRGGVLGAATVAMGLMAGLFFAFSAAVMLGLNKTDDRTLVEVMQKINVAILNPFFGLSFFGALALTALAVMLERRRGPGTAGRWIVAGLVFYICVLAITMGASVPLNNALAKAGDPAQIANLAAVRHHFEGPWVRWNILRTLTCTAALACLSRALMLHGSGASPRA